VVAALLLFPLREYSVTSVIAVGRQPPSPRPARKRSSPNTNADGATAHNAVNTEKAITAEISALRLPITSVIVPMAIAPIVMPTSPNVDATATVPGVSPQTCPESKTGTTTPSATRSNPSSSTAAQESGTTQERVAGSAGDKTCPLYVYLFAERTNGV
jgi:hypothetical protein